MLDVGEDVFYDSSDDARLILVSRLEIVSAPLHSKDGINKDLRG